MLRKYLKKKTAESAPHRPAEAPKHQANHDESNWLVSYADMMTLLCGFFIMLFSMSKLDEPKYEKMKEEVAKQFGGKYEEPSTQELGRFATEILQEMGVQDQTVVKSDPGGVAIVFQSTLFFDTLSAEVKPQGQAILEKLIKTIADKQVKENKKYRIVVEGHTDSRPIVGGVFPSNWELSGARASHVVRMFLDKGFQPDALAAVGYADTRPLFPPRTEAGLWNEEGLAKNRRVVLRVMEPKVDAIPFADSDKSLTGAIREPAAIVSPAPSPLAAQPSPVPSAH